MRFRHKKLFISGTAVTVAGVLGIGALLQTSISVQASTEMMPGIEEIVEKATSDNEPFCILEIVDDKSEAEIGYYISGQEPYVKLYQYTDKSGTSRSFSSLEDGLSKIEDAKTRKEFAENKKYNADETLSNDPTGIKDISYAAQDDSAPLSYSDYQEQYFNKPDDSWKKVDFYNFDGSTRTEKVNVQGKYVPNENGTGDYTKQDQTYYPIRDDEDSQNSSQKFRENIQNFFFSEGETANAPYYLEFEEVTNDSVNEKLQTDSGKNLLRQEYDYTQNRYGYYENVYSNLTTELANDIGTYPGENPTAPTITPILTIDPVVETDKFSEGGESEFTSNEIITQENNSTEVSGDTDSFESGADIGSSASTGDEFSDSEQISADVNTDATVTDSSVPAQAATDQPTGTDSESGSDTNSDSGNNKQTLKPTTAGIAPGTAQNPYVYLGTTINTYPYYSYTAITDLTAAKKEAEDNEKKKNEATDANPYVPKAGDITIEDGQYYYWQKSGNDMVKSPITIITGKQPVAYSDIHEIDQNNLKYNYYYRVSKVYFCCKKQDRNTSSAVDNYQYYGWYYPSYPQGEDAYLPVQNGEKPTYYISDAEYELTPGKGDYDFVQGTDDGTQQYEVEINHMYYTGGYKNNDWFKRYVFHLDPPEDEKTENDFTKFNIQVTTLTKEEFNTEYVQNDNTNASAAQDTSEENFDDSDAAMSVPEDTAADSSDMDSPELSEATDGQVSEVENIVSEAGVELVSIENEINDFSDDSESNTTAANSADNSADTDAVVNQETDTGSTTSETDTSENTTTDFQDGAEEDTDIFSDDADAFSAGEADTTADSPLKDYDLIYINSSLSEAQADIIMSYNNSVKPSEQIPCIINSAKATSTATSTSGITEAFSNFYKAEDTDRHYVNQYVYFFNNTFDGQESGNLLSTSFIKNFNPNSNTDISDGTNSQTEGFEEILEYIESENKYRQLGTATGNDFTDGDQQTVTPTPAPKLLTTELSHARAIEYIINYKYKRQILSKSQINVLEIEPAKSDRQITENKVWKWMGYPSNPEQTVTTCCEEIKAEQDQAYNMTDDNPDTFWHSCYNPVLHQSHTITITYSRPTTVNSIRYLPRKGAGNGTITQFTIRYYTKSETISEENKSWTGTDEDGYSIYEKNVSDVQKIELVATGCNGGAKWASCAELKTDTEKTEVDTSKNPEVKIDYMTSSEYVGHIDDINSKYDIIYIGDRLVQRDVCINGDDGKLYTHVGGRIAAKGSGNNNTWKFMGLYPQDFAEDGIQINSQSPTAGYRGSGNDITQQQYNELMSFVKSGYPVILGNTLLSGNKVNENTVDNSSYIFKFLKDAINYDNVIALSEIEKDSTAFSFFANLAKPVIKFLGNESDNADTGNNSENTSAQYESIDGALVYHFKIENDSSVSTASTRYDCKLYIDLNFDGNLADTEEQADYMEITDSSQVVQQRKKDGNNSFYELKEGVEYTVTRKIPSNYYKLITWKLEIINNANSNIRTSVIGYSKQEKPENIDKISINVLQIVPSDTAAVSKPWYNDNHNYGTWRLKYELDQNEKGLFATKVANLQDFSINITEITAGAFSESAETAKKALEKKQMIIIGFDDVYENINTPGVQAILEFIEQGKSVIFSHDTTSYYNYTYLENIRTTVNAGNTTANLYSNFINDKKKWNWGVDMNTVLRRIVGMDRYGITENKKNLSTNQSVSDLLKQGKDLTDGNGVSLKELMKLAGDVAYKSGSNNTESYKETQGYQNTQINNIDVGGNLVTYATKVNDGAITQYPFVMKDKITIAGTHAQYYQLALEQDEDILGNSDGKNDIVVWYCLSGNSIYDASPNDVRNNYYFYSKGNVIYTGAGHSKVQGEEEINLFINAIVAAANVVAVEPEVNFIKNLSPVAEKETVHYYMTDQAGWNTSDSSERNTLEKDTKLYFDVKEYNMASTTLNIKDQVNMKVELYIEDDQGEVLEHCPEEMKNVKVVSLNGENNVKELIPYGKEQEPITLSSDGKFHLSENNAYGFNISEIEKYLRKADGSYKENTKVFIKVTSTISLYGKEESNESWASVNLKQRQLFDLD